MWALALGTPLSLCDLHILQARLLRGPMDQNPTAPNRISPATPIHPGIALLRQAVRRNIVSFPSQTPAFLKQPPADVQWRMALLFFVRGWRAEDIGARYHFPKHEVCRFLNAWSVRALAQGHIQVIDEEEFACLDTRADRDASAITARHPQPGSKASSERSYAVA